MPRFTNERGGCGARRLRRLSRDHLAHLIKHRGFNLAPLVCRRAPSLKTTFTSSSMAGAADSRRGGRGGKRKHTRRMQMRPRRRSSASRSLTGDTGLRGKISLRLAVPSFAIFLFDIFIYLPATFHSLARICFDAAWLFALPPERSHPR